MSSHSSKPLIHIVRKTLTLILLLMAIAGNSQLTAFADQGDGTGGGNSPLTLVSAQFEDGTNVNGAAGVGCSGLKMKLNFSKNVTDDLVWDVNKACISIRDALGQTVGIDVSRVTGENAFSERQNIYISIGTLQAGTVYQLHVAPELIAKNLMMKIGDATGGQDVVLAFTTADVDVSEPAAVAQSDQTAATDTQSGQVAATGDAQRTVSADIPVPAESTGDAVSTAAALTTSTKSSITAAGITGQDLSQNTSKKKVDKQTYALAAAALILLALAVFTAWKRNRARLLRAKSSADSDKKYLWNLNLKEALGSTLFGVLTVVAGMLLHIPIHIPAHRGLLIMTMMTVGCLLYRRQGTGILIGSIAGFLAVMLGVESKGIFGFFNYFFPGLLMDFLICVVPFTGRKWYLTGLASGISFLSKLASMYLVGMITGIPMGVLSLGLQLTAVSHFLFGLTGGILGYYICMKTPLRRYAALPVKEIAVREEER